MLNYEQFAENLNNIPAYNYPPTLENDGEFIVVPFVVIPLLFPTGFVDFEHQIPARICDGYIAINTFVLADIMNVEPSDITKLFNEKGGKQ